MTDFIKSNNNFPPMNIDDFSLIYIDKVVEELQKLEYKITLNKQIFSFDCINFIILLE